jgi:hypothetical protein
MPKPKMLLTVLCVAAIAAPVQAQGQTYYDQGAAPGPAPAPVPMAAPDGSGQYSGANAGGAYPPAGYGVRPIYHPAEVGYPPQGQVPGVAMSAAGKRGAGAQRAMSVGQWFNAYDNIRHQAQMSPSERQRADSLMSRGLSILMPGDEKVATKALLSNMVVRYGTACQQLKSLPQMPQTTNLHHMYYNYFANAGQLFADYVRVQDNLFIKDAATGQPLASSLLQRKQMLEGLEHQCKQLDGQTRAAFGVAPYAW